MARHPLPAALAWTDTHSRSLKRKSSVALLFSVHSVLNLFPEKAFNTARRRRNQTQLQRLEHFLFTPLRRTAFFRPALKTNVPSSVNT
jgi:hypothetical protein